MKKLVLYLAVCANGFAADLPPVRDVLRSTGKAVEVFWDQFSAINCTEVISQDKLGKEGKVEYRKDSTFNYLVLMRQADSDLAVEESRVSVPRPAVKQRNVPLLVTTGFSTLLFIFHPRFQSSYEFSPPAADQLEDRRVLRLGFRQVRAAPSPSCLRLRGHDYPLEWSGTAWIEPQSGTVLKIMAGLGSSTEDLGLRTLTAEVRYAPVKFSDSAEEQWLPSVATIEAQTPLQHWKNTHQFTNYRRFSVKTSTKTALPE
jgi:hypothetical protein